MLTQEQIETELNLRNYWKEVVYPAPPIEPPVIPPIEPPISPPSYTLPVTPPVMPPSGEGLIDRFGSLVLVGTGVLFLLAIFPGQSDETGGTS